MATKKQWKARAAKARKRIDRMRKIIRTGTKVLAERDQRIAQLESHVTADLRIIAETAPRDGDRRKQA